MLPDEITGRLWSCHEITSDYAPHSLELRSGMLYGHESRQPVRDLLDYHRNLSTGDASFFERVLTRVVHEVYRP